MNFLIGRNPSNLPTPGADMSESEACPKCGAATREYYCCAIVAGERFMKRAWTCKSTKPDKGDFKQSDACRANVLTAENARLREAFIMSHNGDIQIRWNPDGFWAYGRDHDQSLVRLSGPCGEAIEAALTALAPAPGREERKDG